MFILFLISDARLLNIAFYTAYIWHFIAQIRDTFYNIWQRQRDRMIESIFTIIFKESKF